VDDLYAELRASDVLHSPDTVVVDTDYGMRGFAAVDCDGNLLSFYTPITPRADKAGPPPRALLASSAQQPLL